MAQEESDAIQPSGSARGWVSMTMTLEASVEGLAEQMQDD